jgi:GTP cyclohydrolase IA
MALRARRTPVRPSRTLPPPAPAAPSLRGAQARLDTIQGATLALLGAIGEDPQREGLRETPRRVAKFWQEFLTPPPFTFTTFDAEGMDEVVVQHGIPFFSLCEHHLVPFFGHAAVAYLPNGRIVGLSKLARTVQHFAQRLQNQERMTLEIADLLQAKLAPRGVAVVLQARHLCMEMRGARTHDTQTVTSALRGTFRDDARARQELMALLTR